MRTTATISRRRAAVRVPVAPSMFFVGMLLLAVSLAAAWSDLRTPTAEPPTSAGITVAAALAPTDWSFALRADTARVIHHRAGVSPSDFVRTPAFGWSGPMLREVLHDPVYVRELRLNRGLTPVEIVASEART